MDKIFKQAKDKNVAKVIIYGHTDNLLYSDADHTKKINKSNVKDLFVKGCVVRSESEHLLPVKYFETENYAGMVFKSGDSIIAYYSEEYTPAEDVVWEDDITFTLGEGGEYVLCELTGTLDVNTNDYYEFTCGEQTVSGKFVGEEDDLLLATEDETFGIGWYLTDGETRVPTIEILGTPDMFDTETTYHAKLVKSEEPEEDIIWEDSFEFEATEGAIGYEGEYVFPALDKINTTDFFTLAILELDKSITAKFEIQDEEANSYSIRDTDETIVMVIDPTDNYIIIMTDQGDTAGTYTVKLTKSEASEPSV